jgi:hypothetical protein
MRKKEGEKSYEYPCPAGYTQFTGQKAESVSKKRAKATQNDCDDIKYGQPGFATNELGVV